MSWLRLQTQARVRLESSAFGAHAPITFAFLEAPSYLTRRILTNRQHSSLSRTCPQGSESRRELFLALTCVNSPTQAPTSQGLLRVLSTSPDSDNSQPQGPCCASGGQGRPGSRERLLPAGKQKDKPPPEKRQCFEGVRSSLTKRQQGGCRKGPETGWEVYHEA